MWRTTIPSAKYQASTVPMKKRAGKINASGIVRAARRISETRSIFEYGNTNLLNDLSTVMIEILRYTSLKCRFRFLQCAYSIP